VSLLTICTLPSIVDNSCQTSNKKFVRATICVHELEGAINYWRARRPARENELALSAEVNLLTNVYALIIFRRQMTVDIGTVDADVRRLIDDWRRQGA